jgi:hypothetical protein
MRYLWAIVFIVLLFPVIANATTPAVSNVTGTVEAGQILTITGTTMVDEDKTNWIDATANGGPNFTTGDDYGFEHATYESTIYPATPDDNNERVISYDSSVKLMGNRSLKGYDAGASNGNMISTGVYMYTNGASEYYVRWYGRWHTTGATQWPTLWSKMMDLPGSSAMWYWQPPAGSNYPTQLNMRYNDTDHVNSVSNFLQADRWYCFETRMKVNATSNWTTWVDGTQIATASPTLGEGVNLDWILFNGPNYSGTDSSFTMTAWTDNMTVSSARVYCSTMVEICNSATYSGATCVKQPLTTIGDTSIVVTADLTGLSAPYYLYVTNNKQETSSAYSLSGGGDSAPPMMSGGTITGGILQ